MFLSVGLGLYFVVCTCRLPYGVALLTWRGMRGGMPCASLDLAEAMCLMGRSVGASLRVTACRSGLTGQVALTRHRQPCTQGRFAKTSE